MKHIIFICLAFLLVLMNGFFVAAEFAMVRLRNTQVKAIKESFGLRGAILAKIHNQLDAYLSACQLGITLTSLGLGWIGEPAFAKLLEPLLNYLNIFSTTTIAALAFILAFLFISFLHIVIGELAPKSWAIRQSQSISLWTAVPLYLFNALMFPFIWLLNSSANLLLRLFRIENTQGNEASYSSEELKLIVNSGNLHGDLEKEELEMIDNVLEFADLSVADIMRPADEMIALNVNDPISENLQMMANRHFSRYPVYEDNPQKMVGIIHVKDIFSLLQQNKPITDLQTLLRPVLSVNIDIHAIELFRQFKAGFTHFAVVTNNSGVVIGFITLDNILNAILGEIRDEFIKPKPDWITTKDGAWLMRGNTPLYVLEKALDINFSNEAANTISGLIMTKLERIPQPKEKISFEKFDIIVYKLKGPRIALVKVYPKAM